MNIHLRLSNYISRYAPSYRRVTHYLINKKIANPDELLSEMGYNESLMCDMWIQSFFALGKGKRDMCQKLIKKEFPKEMILLKISERVEDIEDWESYRDQITSQIHLLLEKNKSIRIISMNLIAKYPYFRDQIHELLESLSDQNGLQKEVQKYKNKYNLNIPSDRQKFYAALLRKGFGYSEIRESLEEVEEVEMI